MRIEPRGIRHTLDPPKTAMLVIPPEVGTGVQLVVIDRAQLLRTHEQLSKADLPKLTSECLSYSYTLDEAFQGGIRGGLTKALVIDTQRLGRLRCCVPPAHHGAGAAA